MSKSRIIKRIEVEKLRGIESAREEFQRDRDTQLAELEAQREAILQEARARALRDSMQAATKVIVDAEAAAQNRLKALEPQVAALVSSTVAQVIGDMDRSEAVTLATKEALLQLKDHRRARITTASDVAQSVREAVAQIGNDGAEVVDIQVDERLEPGRTVVSSDRGHVEIGLDDQIAAVTEAWSEGAA